MSIITRTPARRNTTTRKSAPAAPKWLADVAAYLRTSGVGMLTMAGLCEWIGLNGDASGNPFVSDEHSHAIDAIIERHTGTRRRQRPGDVGTPQHARQVEVKARLDALLNPAPVKFVTTSTDETPHDPEAIIPTESDWNEYRQLFDRAPIVAPKPRPAAAVLPPG